MKIIATCFWKMLYHYQCNDVVGVLGYKKKSFSGGYDMFVRLIIGLLTGRINVEYFFFAARLERNSRNRMKKVFKNDSTSYILAGIFFESWTPRTQEQQTLYLLPEKASLCQQHLLKRTGSLNLHIKTCREQ